MLKTAKLDEESLVGRQVDFTYDDQTWKGLVVSQDLSGTQKAEYTVVDEKTYSSTDVADVIRHVPLQISVNVTYRNNATKAVIRPKVSCTEDIMRIYGLTREQVLSPVLKTNPHFFEPQTSSEINAIERNSTYRAMWEEARAAEKAALLALKVYILMDRADVPKGQKVITSREVLKIKWLPNGNLDKLKVRITARGFTQVIGIDFNESYSATPGLGTYRIFICICTALG